MSLKFLIWVRTQLRCGALAWPDSAFSAIPNTKNKKKGINSRQSSNLSQLAKEFKSNFVLQNFKTLDIITYLSLHYIMQGTEKLSWLSQFQKFHFPKWIPCLFHNTLAFSGLMPTFWDCDVLSAKFTRVIRVLTSLSPTMSQPSSL